MFNLCVLTACYSRHELTVAMQRRCLPFLVHFRTLKVCDSKIKSLANMAEQKSYKKDTSLNSRKPHLDVCKNHRSMLKSNILNRVINPKLVIV